MVFGVGLVAASRVFVKSDCGNNSEWLSGSDYLRLHDTTEAVWFLLSPFDR